MVQIDVSLTQGCHTICNGKPPLCTNSLSLLNHVQGYIMNLLDTPDELYKANIKM